MSFGVGQATVCTWCGNDVEENDGYRLGEQKSPGLKHRPINRPYRVKHQRVGRQSGVRTGAKRRTSCDS